MILGLSVPAFTLLHVIISLIAIVAGIVTFVAMTNGRKLAGWTDVFLWTTVLTSVTGFFFPITRIGPPHIFGFISIGVLVPVLLGLYVFHLAGGWRGVYVLGSLLTLYLNCVVLIVQSFQKIPFLHQFAPTQTNEPAFGAAQLVLLVLTVLAGFLAFRRFHPGVPVTPRTAPVTT